MKLDPAELVKHLPTYPRASTAYELLEDMGQKPTLEMQLHAEKLLAKMPNVVCRNRPADDAVWSLRR